ncbi:MAG: hypothetical protein KGH64_01165 [Candidatus Micrarchaeota archaeon]|nr:hypothetical protein [Candidatus Micrarchaeota archaeon]MDE1833927.1 hypothetical protein [Candidatus Micrarchaeota archaeon]
MATTRNRINIIQPESFPIKPELEVVVRELISEMIGSRFVDNRDQLRQSGVFFKSTYIKEEYEMMQRMYGVTPGHIPQPLGLVTSLSEGNQIIHGYLLEHIAGNTLELPVKEWMSDFKKDIADQIRCAFNILHSAGISHNDIRRDNVLVRRNDGNVFIIDPAPSITGFNLSGRASSEALSQDKLRAHELAQIVEGCFRYS